jgi:hypothetical protein
VRSRPVRSRSSFERLGPGCGASVGRLANPSDQTLTPGTRAPLSAPPEPAAICVSDTDGRRPSARSGRPGLRGVPASARRRCYRDRELCPRCVRGPIWDNVPDGPPHGWIAWRAHTHTHNHPTGHPSGQSYAPPAAKVPKGQSANGPTGQVGRGTSWHSPASSVLIHRGLRAKVPTGQRANRPAGVGTPSHSLTSVGTDHPANGPKCQRAKVPTGQRAKPRRVIAWHSLAPSGTRRPAVTGQRARVPTGQRPWSAGGTGARRRRGRHRYLALSARCARGWMDCMARAHPTTTQRVSPRSSHAPSRRPRARLPDCQRATPDRVIVWHPLAPSGARRPAVTGQRANEPPRGCGTAWHSVASSGRSCLPEPSKPPKGPQAKLLSKPPAPPPLAATGGPVRTLLNVTRAQRPSLGCAAHLRRPGR